MKRAYPKVRTLGLLLMASAAIAGCSKKDKVENIPPVADGTDYGNQTDPNAGQGGQIVPGSQEDFLASVGQGRDRIFFDTDRYNIDAEDQVTLQGQAQWLARYPQAQATVEGHADERGTRDYNLALGERRANAAKNYLVSLGVDGSRIQTVSYGKERPVATGSNEAAWAQNRRAVTVIIR